MYIPFKLSTYMYTQNWPDSLPQLCMYTLYNYSLYILLFITYLLYCIIHVQLFLLLLFVKGLSSIIDVQLTF